MRYSCTALVLATALISRVAAGPVRHGHQHVHEKKDVDLKVAEIDADLEKKDLPADFWETASIHYTNDWTTMSIWKTVQYTYSEGQTWGDPTPAAKDPAPAPTTTAAPVAPPTTAAPQPVAPPTTTPVATPAAAPASSPAASPAPVADFATQILASSDVSKLLSLGFQAVGINAQESSGGVWIGSDGDYVNEFINSSGEDLVVTIWGPQGSWVNANAPLITHSLPAGSTITISFASGQSGAISAIYPDTLLVNGQVSNTWQEYTFSPEGVIDVSKEVNMNGHSIEVVGPSCTSNMSTCVFQCTDPSVSSCEFDYELLNCSPGSQPGAQSGTYGGAASGGCGWLGASSAKLTTTFY